MSEEKKQNNNQGGHRHRHHYHKHKQKNPQAQAEQKENTSTASEPDVKTSSAPKKPESNHSQKPQGNDNRKRNNKHQKHDKNREKDRENPPEVSTTIESSVEDDMVFSSSFLSVRSKETTVSKPHSDNSDITPLSDDVLFGTAHLIHRNDTAAEETTEIVGVAFKAGGKVYYFDPNGIKVKKGNYAIVDTARGLEFGEVCIPNRNISSKNIVQPLRKLIRVATKEDITHHDSNKVREKDAFKICLEKIASHKLDMKLVEAQYSFDNTKLLFYFTSAGRVDFRELVRDLASVFKTRIELRQIGIRDEAKLLGGIGMCGRPLCCSRHLSNFAQVSIKMAKEQGLSLNANKISGNCGRLMCCLNFENQVYLDEIKITPMPGSIVKLNGTKGVVTDANPLTGALKIHLDGAPEGEKASAHRDEVTVISRKYPESSAENDKKDELPESDN